jgi:acyl transferase domain-containing protein
MTPPIAVVGMACRFPGAPDLDAFWRLLRDGTDAIREVPPDRWDLRALYDPTGAEPGTMTTRWGGFLDRVDGFDPSFFGIAPREAAYMDPQQRLLLEVAWEALEDAGVVLEQWAGRPAGVFVGVSTWDYGALQLGAAERIVDGYANTGSALSIAANRISYLFDLRGPSLAVDTACSSSLTAIHLACQSLLTGESAMALAGGVNVILSPAATIGFSKLKAMAADGRCKSFDARADGYVRSEGAGIVVLKPLAGALRDGDRVHAVIRGSAVNQDGRTNGLTAPNGLSQEALIRHALERAGVEPRQVGYVEAHGTGTPLGDPIELNALGAALAPGRPAGSRCAVGSVKSNLGHLEAAAGVAGLIKVALALEHGEIPPSLHFETPNPHIPFDTLPLEVPRVRAPWPADRRLAGVSSFGFGGTNVHVVLEQAPERTPAAAEPAEPADRAWLVTLSAKSPDALSAAVRDWCGLLRRPGEPSAPAMRDLAYTSTRRRTHHDHRLAVAARSHDELREHLEAHLAGEARPGLATGRAARGRRRRLVFVFPGQGSQWFGMARGLARREPAFLEALERCGAAIRREVGWSLLDELHADAGTSRLSAVDVIQPALWAIQVALAALWRSWGVVPDAVVGHSMGEVAAAHVAGALSLDDAARVICRRSRLLRSTSGRGAMAAVELSVEQARQALSGHEDRVSIAVSNSPSSTVLSGDVAALEEILRALEARGVFCRRVKVDVASHSPQMDPLRADLLAALEGLAPGRPAVPLYSTVTGGTSADVPLDAVYWARNLREPVLFARAVERLAQDGHSIFLELSPHPILLAGVQQTLQHLGKEGSVLPSLRREEDEQAVMLGSLGGLFTLGRPVDWAAVSPDGTLARLPAYPWQRERHWIEPPTPPAVPRRAGGHPLLGAHLQSAADGAHFWEAELGGGRAAYLSDHRVQGAPVLPAAAYLEMALAAARQALGAGPHVVSELEFHKAVLLPGAGTLGVQVILAAQAPGVARFQVWSRASGQGTDAPAALHAAGLVRAAADAPREPDQPRSLDEIRTACTDVVAAVQHYREAAENGLDFGPAFQVVERIWRRQGEALGRLHVPHALGQDAGAYVVHPSLLDGCFQVLAAALGHAARARPRGEAWLVVGVRELRLEAPVSAGEGFWGHAIVAEPHAVAGTLEGDVALRDQSGRVVLRARGLRLRLLQPREVNEEAPAAGSLAPPANGAEDAAAAVLTAAALRSTPAGERQAVLERHLQRRVAGVLRLPPARLDVHRPLSTMGIDSLMAVELKNGVERELEVSLPLIQLIQGPTVAELAALLLEQLAGNGSAPAARPPRAEPTAVDKGNSQLLSLLSLTRDERDA